MNVVVMLKNSLLYIGFDVLVKLLPFFLVLVLTHYLSPEDMGIIAEFTALVGVLSVFCGLSVQGVIGVAFVKLEQEKIGDYVFNVLLILLVSSFITIYLITILGNFIEDYTSLRGEWLYYACLTASMQFINIINTLLWQMEKRPLPYGIFQTAHVTINVLFSLVLVVVMGLAWQGRLIAHISVITLFSLLSLWFLYQRGYLALKINISFIKEALTFGIPLIPHTLAGWFFMGFNIMLISAKLGKEETGIFNVALQFAIAMGIVMDSANRALMPYFYEQLRDLKENNKERLVHFVYLFFFAVIIVGLIIWQLSLLAILWAVNEQFQSSQSIVGYLIVGYLFNGLYYFLAQFITYQNKNYLVTAITLFSAAVHVFFATLLVQYYGLVGVAFASILSGLTMFLLAWFTTMKVTPLPWFSLFTRTN